MLLLGSIKFILFSNSGVARRKCPAIKLPGLYGLRGHLGVPPPSNCASINLMTIVETKHLDIYQPRIYYLFNFQSISSDAPSIWGDFFI